MVNLNVGVSDPVPVSGDSRANDSSAGEKAKQYLKDISIIADSNMDQKEKLDRIAVRTEEFIKAALH
jgi:hypothetical protein